MEDKIVQIQIQFDPARLKDKDFVDTLYLRGREVQLPESEVFNVVTSRKHKTVINQNEHRQVLVQSQRYYLHSIEAVIPENVDLDLVKTAESISVITDNLVYDAELYSYTTEELQQGVKIYSVTIVYKERANDEDAISSHAESSQVEAKYSADGSWLLYLSPSKSIDNEFASGNYDFRYYTSIYPDISRSELQKDTIEKADRKQIITRSTDFETYLVKLFLTEDDKNNLIKYLERSYRIDDNGDAEGVELSLGRFVITSVIPPIYEVVEREDLVDLFEVNVTIYTDYTDYYHF